MDMLLSRVAAQSILNLVLDALGTLQTNLWC